MNLQGLMLDLKRYVRMPVLCLLFPSNNLQGFKHSRQLLKVCIRLVDCKEFNKFWEVVCIRYFLLSAQYQAISFLNFPIQTLTYMYQGAI